MKTTRNIAAAGVSQRVPGGCAPAGPALKWRLHFLSSAWTQFEQTGRVEWVTDLAEIPEHYGVANVYADLGQIFAQSTVAHLRLCAALMGIPIQGLGADHVCWGTDAIWTGSPRWQIEALRRLEIPDDLQKQYGFQLS